MNTLRVQTLLSFAACFMIAQVVSLYKVNLIGGTSGGVLSASLIPIILSGLYAGLAGSAAVLLFRQGLKFLFFGLSTMSLTLYFPTLCASLYLSSGHWLIGVGIPVLCTVLFLAHPAGAAAWFYSLFWIIPIVLHFFAHRHVFIKMVVAVFVAHALGTVLWIGFNPLSPAMYGALMPVVIFERIALAAGMYVLHMVLDRFSNVITRMVTAYGAVLKKS